MSQENFQNNLEKNESLNIIQANDSDDSYISSSDDSEYEIHDVFESEEFRNIYISKQDSSDTKNLLNLIEIRKVIDF
jgi:hypothetical protein